MTISEAKIESTFQSFFSGYYPQLRSSLISPVDAHMCLLGIHIINDKQLQRAAIALNVALNKWLNNVEVNYNMIHISVEEMAEVAKFIRLHGRVSIADLSAASSTLVNLTPQTDLLTLESES